MPTCILIGKTPLYSRAGSGRLSKAPVAGGHNATRPGTPLSRGRDLSRHKGPASQTTQQVTPCRSQSSARVGGLASKSPFSASLY